MPLLRPANTPTVYFIGGGIEQSSIIKVFPEWAKDLGLRAVVKGIDLPPHAPAVEYRKTAQFLKDDPLSLGAFVAAHEQDMFKACRDIFDLIEPYAEKLEEVSCLSKRDGKFCAHAKDPVTSGLALEAFVPVKFWEEWGGEALLLGAGGRGIAMAMFFALKSFGGNVPKRVTVADMSEQRLLTAKEALQELNDKIEFRFVQNPKPDDNDRLIAALPPYSLIVNTIGMDKGTRSPTTNAVSYPCNSLVWETDYWGDLLFMRQAQAQQRKKNLFVKDGWLYFIYDWVRVMEEVFHIKTDIKTLDKLNGIARAIRRKQIMVGNVEWAGGVVMDFDFTIGLA